MAAANANSGIANHDQTDDNRFDKEISSTVLIRAHNIACVAMKLNVPHDITQKLHFALRKNNLKDGLKKWGMDTEDPKAFEMYVIAFLVCGLFGNPDNLMIDCPKAVKLLDDFIDQEVKPNWPTGTGIPVIPNFTKSGIPKTPCNALQFAFYEAYCTTSFKGAPEDSEKKYGLTAGELKAFLNKKVMADLAEGLTEAPELYTNESIASRQLRHKCLALGGGNAKTLFTRWCESVWLEGKERDRIAKTNSAVNKRQSNLDDEGGSAAKKTRKERRDERRESPPVDKDKNKNKNNDRDRAPNFWAAILGKDEDDDVENPANYTTLCKSCMLGSCKGVPTGLKKLCSKTGGRTWANTEKEIKKLPEVDTRFEEWSASQLEELWQDKCKHNTWPGKFPKPTKGQGKRQR